MAEFKPWRVLHLDLREGIPDLPADPEAAASFVVLWWDDIPLGELTIRAEERPVPAAQLAERVLDAIVPAVGDRLFAHGFRGRLPDRHPPPDPPTALADLLAAERPLDVVRDGQMAPDTVPVSVIVCTRDRPEALAACLRALQTLAPRPQEILVVDNAPRTEATRELVAQMPSVRYLREPRPGLSAARNAGIRHTTAPLVAFTDDDVIVHPRWVGRLAEALAEPGVMAATGLVLPAELATEAQVRFQHGHSGFGWGYRALTFDAAYFARMERWAVPVWHVGAGANMAFRREVFDEVGGFDERLGAGASGCSEDSEMWYRVLAAGHACRYEPAAVVHHVHRSDEAGFRDQMYQYMRGHVAALLVQHEKHGHRGNLRRAFGSLPWYYGRWALRRALGRRGGPHYLRAQMRGCAAGVAYYLRHRTGAPASPDVSPPA